MNLVKVCIRLLLLYLLCSGVAQSEQKPSMSKVDDFKSSEEAAAHRSKAYLRTHKIPLSATLLTYGKRQVERMLNDRPAMRHYVTVGDPIYTYAVRMFAGAAAGTPIAWHNELPKGADADHQYPDPDRPGFIRVSRCCITGARKGQECTGEELWRVAIFELNNIRNAARFSKNRTQAYLGKINKQKYIATITRLEYKALQESLEVYETLWKPCMQAKGIAVDPTVWCTDSPPTYD